MRIVGGKLRGRAITAPKAGSSDIRPTTDRARESLFNVIQHNYPELLDQARVLDLFSGTGALGFEAISRGASSVLFVESGTQARGLLRQTIQSLGLEGTTKLFRRDATNMGTVGTTEPFGLVFADPPYGRSMGEQALNSLAEGKWLKREALVVLEEARNASFTLPRGYMIDSERLLSSTILRFIRPVQ